MKVVSETKSSLSFIRTSDICDHPCEEIMFERSAVSGKDLFTMRRLLQRTMVSFVAWATAVTIDSVYHRKSERRDND